MRVLMVSIDRGLLEDKEGGDVISRHKMYADLVGELDVIVFSKERTKRVIAKNLRVFSSESTKLKHWKKSFIKAIELNKEKPYDLLVTQDFASPAGEAIKKSIGTPWIVSSHGMFFSRLFLGSNIVNWFLLWRIKASLVGADGFRSNNELLKLKLNKWGIEEPFLVQPTPVNVYKFTVEKKPENKVPVILYVGRLSPEKNVEMLIRAVGRLSANSYRLQIVGDGRERKKLERLAQGNSQINFLGLRSHDELVEIYKKADIFVLPSNTESFGKVLVEAAAGKCALVATRTVGASSIIEDGKSGIFIGTGNQKELEQTLVRLVKDRDLARKLGKNAQEMSQNYNPEKATQNIVNFWKKIANTT